ncbi:Asb3 [Symbiodinium natans]|uniref:Asb3 protein n=1 Tax=Symbiodinium natans TaxID=878477 RepID=A0A812S405_9DINO|nr:Asb3 [Symbiodinium natans]
MVTENGYGRYTRSMETLDLVNEIAGLLQEVGDSAEAEKLYRRVLAGREALDGSRGDTLSARKPTCHHDQPAIALFLDGHFGADGLVSDAAPPIQLEMLRVWKASGEELPLDALGTEERLSVRELKSRLEPLCGHPRFQQRLLHLRGWSNSTSLSGSLDDSEILHGDVELTLICQSYAETTQQQIEALVAAAARGLLFQVEELLSRPQDPNLSCANNSDFTTPLGMAVRSGHVGMVRLLLEAHADPSQGFGEQEESGWLHETPLSTAVSRNDLEIVQALLTARADANQEFDQSGMEKTALGEACFSGFEDVARALLSARANPRQCHYNWPHDIFASPLLVAVRVGQLKIVRLLLEARARCDMDSPPPLAAACQSQRRHAGIVDALLSARADPRQEFGHGQWRSSPIGVALSMGHFEIARMMEHRRDETSVRQQGDEGYVCSHVCTPSSSST